MHTFITSDTHLNHEKLIQWGRPADFQKRELDALARLPAQTELIHLGDFCIGKDAEMAELWNQATQHIEHRVLIRGNHDRKSDSWYLSHGFDAVFEQAVRNMYGKTIIFSHVPVDPDRWPATGVNIHGHTHGNRHRDHDVKDFYDEGYHVEIAMENTHYQPVLLTNKLVDL